jgi:hypothetical protein
MLRGHEIQFLKTGGNQPEIEKPLRLYTICSYVNPTQQNPHKSFNSKTKCCYISYVEDLEKGIDEDFVILNCCHFYKELIIDLKKIN